MALDHEKLEVYRYASELLESVDSILEELPRGRAHFKGQLDRAATSIVLNIAEGAGEFSPDEKERFYRMARRSAVEVAAILDIIGRRRAAPEALRQRAHEQTRITVAMLVRLITSVRRAGARAGAGAG